MERGLKKDSGREGEYEVGNSVFYMTQNCMEKNACDKENNLKCCGSVIQKEKVHKKEYLKEAKYEIIESEARYLIGLNILKGVFLQEEDLQGKCGPDKWQKLFGNIQSIKAVSEVFLNDMLIAWETNENFYKTIRFFAKHYFRVYISYCENIPEALETLENLLEKNREFKEKVRELEEGSECQGQILLSFLITPVQRITRLPLLLESIMSKLPPEGLERIQCQIALNELKQLVRQCDKRVKPIYKAGLMK